MWDGGKAGVGEKKFGLFQGDEGGEGGRAAALNIFHRDNRSRVSSRSCCEGSTYRIYRSKFVVER